MMPSPSSRPNLPRRVLFMDPTLPLTEIWPWWDGRDLTHKATPMLGEQSYSKRIKREPGILFNRYREAGQATAALAKPWIFKEPQWPWAKRARPFRIHSATMWPVASISSTPQPATCSRPSLLLTTRCGLALLFRYMKTCLSQGTYTWDAG